MKKVSITVFTILISVAGFSQVQFGVKAGLNLSSFVPGVDNPGYKTSFNAGALLSVPLFTGFHFQPEIMYSGQGYEQAFSGESMHIETGYLNVPLLFKYQHETGFFAETGPQIGFLLSAHREIDNIKTNIKNDFATVDFSWALGLGYKFSEMGLGIDARYNIGLTNVNKDSQSSMSRNSVFQLGLFYMFEFEK